MRSSLALGIASVLVVGCGDPAEPPTPSPTVGAEAEAPPDKPSAIDTLGITPPEQPWAEMDFDEREFYMIGKVLPIAEEVFRGFDAHAFAEFGCESCHGEDGEARDFAMPPPDLPTVPAPGTDEFAQMEKDQPRMVRFMRRKVTPTTATILGFDEFDPETGEGFGCNGCHPTP
jgi:hypothetical protein